MINVPIWFWQTSFTPHMGGLAEALAKRGIEVTFVSNVLLPAERSHQGWETPELNNAKFALAPNKGAVLQIVSQVPENSIHLCQGLRGNGLVGVAQQALRKRKLRQWVIMETVDDEGLSGLFRRLFYRALFLRWRYGLAGFLAIGRQTTDWIVARGVNRNQVYQFAYFLNKPRSEEFINPTFTTEVERAFRFIYVGRLVKQKKVDLLINSIAAIKHLNVELWILGNGPEELALRSLADSLLPGHVRWLGCLPMHAVSNVIRQADCLVLPSRYDGWGAVVSEALMVGTPAITSDACGSSVAVKASGVGGVFPANDQNALIDLLSKQLTLGAWPPMQRLHLSEWAKCLGSEAGAAYLEVILNQEISNQAPIAPPWMEHIE